MDIFHGRLFVEGLSTANNLVGYVKEAGGRWREERRRWRPQKPFDREGLAGTGLEVEWGGQDLTRNEYVTMNHCWCEGYNNHWWLALYPRETWAGQ